MSKTAIIGGISGQDGSLLAKHLFDQGFKVIGTSRDPSANKRFWRLSFLGILDKVEIIDGAREKIKVINKYNPDECYNLEGQSSVAESFETPHDTIASNGLTTLDWLEAIRLSGCNTKFYQASSAEIFGTSRDFSRSEISPIHPRSPYAVSKLFSHYSTVNYREAYDIFACCGILFNHESPLRGNQFVTQKITNAVAEWKLGKQEPLEVGNIYVKRDWGHAKDFVEGMRLMLQQEKPDDYVLATGKLHSVKDFIDKAFAVVDISLKWQGEGLTEEAYDSKSGKLCVKVSEKYYRPSDMEQSLGNPIKAKNVLGWKTKYDLNDVIEEMVSYSLKKNSA